MLTHKIRIYPSKKQEQLLLQTCGIARFTYNWGLAKWKEMYEKKEKPNFRKIHKAFCVFKKTEKDFSWLYDVTKCSATYALMHLQFAFERFFKKQARYPQFKKKKIGRGNFSIANDSFWIKDKICKLPKIGKLPTAERLRFSGKIMKGAVSHVGKKWFLSIVLKAEKQKNKNNKVVGIDFGIKDNLVLSTGEKLNLPDLQKNYNKIKTLQRRLSRKLKGSKNRYKATIKLQNYWYKLLNKKKDWLEKITTTISKKYRFIALETLNIKGMMKNKKISAKFQRVGLYQFIERLKTKAKVIQIDRFFPSSQLCSNCGHQNKSLTLRDRVWKCPECNKEHDRDINAAMNIVREAISEFKLVDKKALALIPCVLE